MQKLPKWLPPKSKILFLRLTFHLVVISKRVKMFKISAKINLWNVANQCNQIELNNQTTIKYQLIVKVTKKTKLLLKKYLKILDEEVILLKIGSKNKARTVLQRPARIRSGLIPTTPALLKTRRVLFTARPGSLLNGKRSEYPALILLFNNSKVKELSMLSNSFLRKYDWLIPFAHIKTPLPQI